MSLKFVGEAGVYLPDIDSVKITAMDGDRVIDCHVSRSALVHIGCSYAADGSEMVKSMQLQRDTVELAAMIKYRRAMIRHLQLEIHAADVAAVLPAAAA
jgi:hypothetical protein